MHAIGHVWATSTATLAEWLYHCTEAFTVAYIMTCGMHKVVLPYTSYMHISHHTTARIFTLSTTRL